MDYDYINTRIIPSYLGSETLGVSQDTGTFSTFQLLSGEVQELIWPSSPKNISRKYLEYKVKVFYRQGNEGMGYTTIPNCQLINMFGGQGDYCQYTLRADRSSSVGNGAKVLVLCILGEKSKGVIIGGIRSGLVADQSAEPYYRWKFNGLGQSVESDGSWTIEANGPTDGAGTPTGDTSLFPTKISIDGKGTFTVETKDQNQSIKVDNEENKITIDADQGLEANSGASIDLTATTSTSITSTTSTTIISGTDTTVTATGAISFTAGGALALAGGGGIAISPGGGMGGLGISPDSSVSIEGIGLKIGDGTESFPKFSTYRAKESALHQTLITGLTSMAGVLTPLSGVLAPLAALGTTLTAMATAIQSFESMSASYVSLKNKND